MVEASVFLTFVIGSGIINTVVKRIEEMNDKVHNLAFDVAFVPLKCKINSMSTLQVRMLCMCVCVGGGVGGGGSLV